MKKVFTVIFLAMLTACHPDSVYLSEQDNERDITLSVGQTAIIALAESQTTGYSWVFEIKPDAQNVIGNIKEKYIYQRTKLVGSGGIKEFSFKAENAGKVVIYGYYRRPWESPDIAPVQTVHYTIFAE